MPFGDIERRDRCAALFFSKELQVSTDIVTLCREIAQSGERVWHGDAALVERMKPTIVDHARASVIIPAHDEASVIVRCLSGLLAEATPGEFEVIVVANGCADATAALAREFSAEVSVLELAIAGKATALNAGDAAARYFPRVYLDADVGVTTATIRAVISVLERGAFVAAPRLHVNLENRPLIVCSWYRTWLEMPYVRDGLVGSGLYGLSRQGRERFDEFPETMADDFFVRSRFKSVERVVLEGAFMQVEAPFSGRGLLAARTRIAAVNRADSALFSHAQRVLRSQHRRSLLLLVGQPRRLPAALVYLAVEVAARLRAATDRLLRRPIVWRRDETARRRAGGSRAAVRPTR